MLRALPLLLGSLAAALALSTASQTAEHVALRGSNAAGYLPVVLWHGECRRRRLLPLPPLPPFAHANQVTPFSTAGMGDSCCADYSIGAVRELIERELPGVFVHSINTGAGASSVSDILSSYFGSVNDQVRASAHHRDQLGA